MLHNLFPVSFIAERVIRVMKEKKDIIDTRLKDGFESSIIEALMRKGAKLIQEIRALTFLRLLKGKRNMGHIFCDFVKAENNDERIR